jgi:hypothetical protein
MSMAEERNKHTLRTAIRALPRHEADPGLWPLIDERLKTLEADDWLRKVSRRLPAHSPPPEVWESVAVELDRQPAARRVWLKPALAAAAITLLFLVFRPEMTPIETNESIFGYEKLHAEPNDSWNNDEAAFVAVLARYDSHPFLKEDPRLREIIAELRALEIAKQELENALRRADEDTETRRRIGKIERARSQALRRLAALM